jgi:tRNA (guanine26-N2/guanine27-N2)-dimethyltransferase
LVDVDPYGTPAPFLESGLRSTRTGGLLAVTATDMAVLAGPDKATCKRRYGGIPVRGYLSREAGLRLLVAHVATFADGLGLSVRPVLSFIGGYYVRVYLRVTQKEEEMKGSTCSLDNLGPVPFEEYRGPPLPPGTKAGPLWVGNLHDRDFTLGLGEIGSPGDRRALDRFIQVIKKEVQVDVLFYYQMSELAKLIGISEPPRRELVLEYLRKQGWSSERTHASPAGWRTLAPLDDVKAGVASVGKAFIS